MDIQTLLISYARGNIELQINNMSKKIINEIISKIEKQLHLYEISKNKEAIPHINSMKKIQLMLKNELERRVVE